MNQWIEGVCKNSEFFKNVTGVIGCINMSTDYTLCNFKKFAKLN